MMSTSLRIPAGRFQDEAVLCRVQQGGTVVAFRNHAHRLARGVWSDHWDANGRAQPPLGNLVGAAGADRPPPPGRAPPRRRRRAAAPLPIRRPRLENGDDARPRRARQEMCNQYLVGETSLAVRCEGHAARAARAAAPRARRRRRRRRPPSARSRASRSTAAAGTTSSTAFKHVRCRRRRLRADAIVRVPAAGASSGARCGLGGLFGVGVPPGRRSSAPASLWCRTAARDHRGYLWATDVSAAHGRRSTRRRARWRCASGRRGGRGAGRTTSTSRPTWRSTRRRSACT